MLQPLRVAHAPPALTAPQQNADLTGVCAIEGVRCTHKTKRSDGASCYVIDSYQYAQPPPSSDNAMLSPHWTAEDAGKIDRPPDASIARPYLDVWTLARSLAKVSADCQRDSERKCRLCHNMVAYVATMDRGSNALRRIVLTPILKQREIQELVGTFVAIVVRSQHAPAPHAVHERNCANENTIAGLLVEFLGLP